MTTTNRLVKATPAADSKLTAAEWAAIAREKGRSEAAKAWDVRAMELGEQRIPNGTTVRFDSDGGKHRVSFQT